MVKLAKCIKFGAVYRCGFVVLDSFLCLLVTLCCNNEHAVTFTSAVVTLVLMLC